jgi:hypothetical protein
MVTRDRNNHLPVAPNLLDGQFTVAQPNKVRASDGSKDFRGVLHRR